MYTWLLKYPTPGAPQSEQGENIEVTNVKQHLLVTKIRIQAPAPRLKHFWPEKFPTPALARLHHPCSF
jgi:hypothetical protein